MNADRQSLFDINIGLDATCVKLAHPLWLSGSKSSPKVCELIARICESTFRTCELAVFELQKK